MEDFCFGLSSQRLVALMKSAVVSLDTEYDGSKPPCRTELHGVSLAWGSIDSPDGQYFDFEKTYRGEFPAFQRQVLYPLCHEPQRIIAMWNAKVDLQVLRALGVKFNAIVHCGMVMAFLNDENERKGLKETAKRLLQVDVTETLTYKQTQRLKERNLKLGLSEAKVLARQGWEVYRNRFKKKNKPDNPVPVGTNKSVAALVMSYKPGMNRAEVVAAVLAKVKPFKIAEYTKINEERFARYATDDAKFTYSLYFKLRNLLQQQSLWDVFLNQEMPIMRALAEIEEAGVRIDMDELMKLRTTVDKMATESGDNITNTFGLEFNPGSPAHLKELFWVKMAIKPPSWIKLGKDGLPSTDAPALKWLAEEKKIKAAIDILRLRRLDKVMGTYVEPLFKYADSDPENRIHCSLNPVGAETGRFSSSGPALQTIPRSGSTSDLGGVSLRRVFSAKPGYKLVVVDLSQIELRMMAHMSRDPRLIEAYSAWSCTECGASGHTQYPVHECPECLASEVPEGGEKKGYTLGKDIHTQTALLTGLTKQMEKKAARQTGKTANFALIYGCGAEKLEALCKLGVVVAADDAKGDIDKYATISHAVRQYVAMRKAGKKVEVEVGQYERKRTLGFVEIVALRLAERIKDKYFDSYKGVEAFHSWVERQLAICGEFKMISGRKRRFHEDHKEIYNKLSIVLIDHGVRGGLTKENVQKAIDWAKEDHRWKWWGSQREATNSVIQGSSADLMKRAMNSVLKQLATGKYEDSKVLLTVHDELVLEAREDIASKVLKMVIWEMEHSYGKTPLRVPVLASGAIGSNWEEAK